MHGETMKHIVKEIDGGKPKKENVESAEKRGSDRGQEGSDICSLSLSLSRSLCTSFSSRFGFFYLSFSYLQLVLSAVAETVEHARFLPASLRVMP